MKLRALICLLLAIIVISDVTAVASINASNVTTTKTTNVTTVEATNVTTVVVTNIEAKTIPFEYVVTIQMFGHARTFTTSRPLRSLVGHVNIDGNQFRVNRTLAASWWTETPRRNVFSFVVNRGINNIYL